MRLFSLDVLIRGTQTFTFCTQISNKFIEKNNEKYISHQNVDGRRGEMRCAVKGPFRLSDYKCESGVREGAQSVDPFRQSDCECKSETSF